MYFCQSKFKNQSKMDKNIFGNITDCLGSKEDRYFSNGFKSVEVMYNDFRCEDGILSSNINVRQGKRWSKKNGENLKPHLGTTEFVSIAAVVAQRLLQKEKGLIDHDLEISWISRFTCKVRQCTDIDHNCISVMGKIISTDAHVDIFSKSIIQVQIGSVQVMLHVCHPDTISSESCKNTDNAVDFYQKGYKYRDHDITNIILDIEKMTSCGKVILYDENTLKKGIGAKYSGMMFTDFVLVTGQLTQALLYGLNNSDREKSNNMWLREIDVWCELPPMEKKCNSEIKFLNVNILNINGESWQSVTLSGSLGNMNSKIKVAQKINQSL